MAISLPYDLEKELSNALDDMILDFDERNYLDPIVEIIEKYWLEQEDNKKRFMKHLSEIAFALDICWTDGDFPLNEVLKKISPD